MEKENDRDALMKYYAERHTENVGTMAKQVLRIRELEAQVAEHKKEDLEKLKPMANPNPTFITDPNYVMADAHPNLRYELLLKDYAQLQREHNALLNNLQTLYEVQGIKYIWNGKLVERVALSIYPVMEYNPVEETREGLSNVQYRASLK